MKSGVYIIINLINKLVYIGSSYNTNSRITRHKWELKNNIHKNIHLQRAWNKYGKDSFEFKILEQCLVEELIKKEQYWIDHYKSCTREFGYNIEQAERHGLSDECKQRMSESLRGRPAWNKGKKNIFSAEALEKIAAARRGKPSWNSGKTGIFSKESRKKISEHHMGNKYSLGHKHSAVTKQKMSASHIGRKLGPFTKEHKINLSASMKGRVPWNKGRKNVYSKETLEKMSRALLGNSRNRGKGKKQHKKSK